MASVFLAHENLGEDKRVESRSFPRLDEGSIPSWSTKNYREERTCASLFVFFFERWICVVDNKNYCCPVKCVLLPMCPGYFFDEKKETKKKLNSKHRIQLFSVLSNMFTGQQYSFY